MMTDIVPWVTTAMVFVAIFIGVGSAGYVWDRIASRYVADLQQQLSALGVNQSRLARFMRLWGIAIGLVFFILWFVLGAPPIAITVVFLVYITPRVVLNILLERRKRKLRDQLVGATVSLANSCRAGLNLAQGMASIARDTPQPLRVEIGRIVSEYEHGRPLPEAIEDTKNRLQLDSFTLFASAVLVSLERGGRITDSLENISRSLEENQRLERKLEAETASGKSVVWILSICPFAFLLMFGGLHPEGTSLMFNTLIGQIILSLIIALVYISARWSQKILHIEF